MNRSIRMSLRDILVQDGSDGLATLFQDAHAVHYAAGEMIFAAKEPGKGIILIDAGRVEISIMTLAGKKSVLAHMAPGELLGEIAALDGGERSADAVAATKVSGRFLARENLLDFIAERPTLAKAMIVALCQKTRNASDMFLNQSQPESEVRLARTLLRLFDTWGVTQPDGSTALTQKFSQQDIGEFCGLARENVNRQISAWGAAGLLKKDRQQLALIDRARLADIAEV